jgi:hypothetical protein
MKIRTLLLGLSSLLVAVCAAFFSVTGLGKLFAGASFEVMIMAGSLEFAKLVTASFLYAYWDRISKLLKTYLMIGTVVLVMITSLGIYGFLTSAYQTTADELSVMDSKVGVIELKKQRFQTQLDLTLKERESLNESISSLTGGISNAVNQSVDRRTGQVITNVSTGAQRNINDQLTQSRGQRDVLSKEIEALTDSISTLDKEIFEIKAASTVAGEVGPLRYLSDITGWPMANIVNIFALLIVFVFDPLAVSLVIAFNTAMKLDTDKKPKSEDNKDKLYKIYGEKSDANLTQKPKRTQKRKTAKKSKRANPKVNKVVEEVSEPIEISTLNDTVNEVEENKIEDIANLIDDQNSTSQEVKDILDEDLIKDESRRGIDTNDDGKIEGWDTNGDGMIDEYKPQLSSRSSKTKKQKPYYARPDFDWNDRQKWIFDQNAINYYLTYVKKDDENQYLYPEDFDSKVY